MSSIVIQDCGNKVAVTLAGQSSSEIANLVFSALLGMVLNGKVSTMDARCAAISFLRSF